MRPIGAYSSVLVLALVGTAACEEPRTTASKGGHEPWLWQVLAVREATAEDVPFEESSNYLWSSNDPNDVVGPDSLRALVRTNEESRPQIYLEDLRTGTTELLFPGYGFKPRWSPDGHYIACTEWKSLQRFRDLTIVEVPSGRVLEGPVAAGADTKKWSPDASTIAVSGIRYGVGHAVLYTLRVPDLSVQMIDTTAVVASYYHSWSPDSQWLVYTRPTAIDQTAGDTIAADVWIVSAASGEQSCVLASSEWIETEPLWITNRSVLVKRTHWSGSNFGIIEHKVLELEFTPQQSRAGP